LNDKPTPVYIRVLRWVVLLVVIGLSILLFIHRHEVEKLGVYGYPGIFLVSLFSNASIILPVPGVIITTAMGSVFNPWYVALAAGTGASLGEISGYLAGFSGQGVAANIRWYDRLKGWMRKYGEVIVLVMAIIPNPLFDVAGMVAGALRMPLWRFLIWCWIGKVIKMLLFALGGATIFKLIPGF